MRLVEMEKKVHKSETVSGKSSAAAVPASFGAAGAAAAGAL